MAKATILLFLVLAAATAAMAATSASTAPVGMRRSRFLMTQQGQGADPYYYYSCSKKSAAAFCLAAGSPGATCCGGRCVDTGASGEHCGGCNKACKHGRSCCGGRAATTTVLLLLLVLAAAAATAPTTSMATIPTGRSRFLLAHQHRAAGAGDPYYYRPLPSMYGCSEKSAAMCVAPGSPGATCCGGRCVDTAASGDHCGGCNKACKHGRTCCGGRCVDLLFDRDNCGSCSNRCSKRCTYGLCNYAQ
uniref:4Fe-4S ferredoxin-type domain-containing protein n=1 Tax=Oryza barthii TaxID=65489 RepID=A0A0D3G5C7_9ORYZ